jgi:EAL domain-containing protein (putative c-di-GMP-specific phosphodiesterase class I)
MTITAEGIEDPEQRSILISEGCTQGQGFLFSAAVPAEQALALLETRRRAASA